MDPELRDICAAASKLLGSEERIVSQLSALPTGEYRIYQKPLDEPGDSDWRPWQKPRLPKMDVSAFAVPNGDKPSLRPRIGLKLR